MDLLDKYPQLAQYISKDENGIMKISSEGFDNILKNQREKLEFDQTNKSQSKISEIRAQIKVNTEELRKVLQDSLSNFKDMSDEDVQKIAEVVANNQEVIKEGNIESISKLLEDNGIDFSKYTELNGNINELVRNIISSKGVIVDFDTGINNYTNQIGLYTNAIATAIGENNPNYNKSENKGLINPRLGEVNQEEYDRAMSFLNDLSFGEVINRYMDVMGKSDKDAYYTLGQKYGVGTDKSFYAGSKTDENRVNFEDAKRIIATKYAEDATAEKVDKLTNEVDTGIKALNSLFPKLGEATRDTKEGKDLRELYSREYAW